MLQIHSILKLNNKELKEFLDTKVSLYNNKNFIEIQGTAEQQSFSKNDLNNFIELAEVGCSQLMEKQKKIIGSFFN